MPTVSYLIADMQVKMGDPSGNIYTSTNLLNWLNEAQKDFAQRQFSNRLVDATSVAAGQNRFGLPSDRIVIELVASRFKIPKVLRHVTPTEYENQVAACPGAVSYDPEVWTEMDGQLYVYPAYGASSASTTLATAITSTDTTVRISTATDFPLTGRVSIVDADDGNEVEEMEYALLDKTTGVMTGCARGLAHTEPASGVVIPPYPVNHLPLYIVYRTAPETLAASTDTPEIKSIYHEQLELYVMYLAYLQTGETEKSAMMWKRYAQTMKDIQWNTSKEDLSMIGVHDLGTQGRETLYGPRG